MTNEKQLQTAYDSMTALCATLQNKVLALEAQSCSKLSKDWISVDDRLPEAVDIYSDFVLVVDEDYDIVVAYYNSADNYWVVMYLNITVRPSHWMPLPEPPKPTEIDGIKKENNDE